MEDSTFSNLIPTLSFSATVRCQAQELVRARTCQNLHRDRSTRIDAKAEWLHGQDFRQGNADSSLPS
jgi:hypothetical protein